jgi:hypothetical protein
MKRLVNTLILLTSLGCRAECGRAPAMAYEFDKVSLEMHYTHRNVQTL